MLYGYKRHLRMLQDIAKDVKARFYASIYELNRPLFTVCFIETKLCHKKT